MNFCSHCGTDKLVHYCKSCYLKVNQSSYNELAEMYATLLKEYTKLQLEFHQIKETTNKRKKK